MTRPAVLDGGAFSAFRWEKYLIYSEDRRLHTYYVPGGVDWELVTAAVGA